MGQKFYADVIDAKWGMWAVEVLDKGIVVSPVFSPTAERAIHEAKKKIKEIATEL